MQNQNDGQSPASGDHVDEKLLGDPIRVFRAKLVTRAAVAVSGIVMVAGGIYLFVGQGSDIGTIPLLVGICALALAYFMGKSKYLIGPDGVIKDRWGHRQMCRWDEVSEIRDRHVTQGLVTSRMCILVMKNGARMDLPDLGIGDFAKMHALIRQQAESHGLPWKEERIAK
jgi:hypothetical protein